MYSHLNPSPNKLCFFMCLQSKSFENTVGKGGIAHNEQFLLFSQYFLPVKKTFRDFQQIWNCRLQTFILGESKICRLGKGKKTIEKKK